MLLKLFNFSRNKPKVNSAAIAKERLQIVIAHERAERNSPAFLPSLRDELLAVVRKYYPINSGDVKVSVEREGGCEVLELNVTLPDAATSKAHASAP